MIPGPTCGSRRCVAQHFDCTPAVFHFNGGGKAPPPMEGGRGGSGRRTPEVNNVTVAHKAPLQRVQAVVRRRAPHLSKRRGAATTTRPGTRDRYMQGGDGPRAPMRASGSPVLLRRRSDGPPFRFEVPTRRARRLWSASAPFSSAAVSPSDGAAASPRRAAPYRNADAERPPVTRATRRGPPLVLLEIRRTRPTP